MRLDRALVGAALFGLFLAASPDLRAAPDPQAADAAFDAGDTPRALALYDEILADNPGDLNALLRSGKLLSWDRKYDEALSRYDRALTREPNSTPILLERAKVLLWAARYDEAVFAFGRVLKAEPMEPWALCGTAQAYAWRGRGREARPFYERALEAQPGMKEAVEGLDQLNLEGGETETAKQPERALEPWVQIGAEKSDDSEENEMETYRAEGGVALPARLDVKAGYAHTDVHGPVAADPHADGNADALYAVLGWQPREGQRGELRLGATRLKDSKGDGRTVGTGGLSYAFPMVRWTGRAAIFRDPFLYSPRILDNEIDVTSLTFGAAGPASARCRIETNAGYGDFSDGNRRLSADAGAWYVWARPQRKLLAGGVVRYLGFSESLDHGYFDPSRLLAVVVSVRSDGSIGSSAWQYESAVEAGVQSFTLRDAEVQHEPLWNAYGLVSWPLPHGLSLQFYAILGNSSAAAGPGFRSWTGGVRLRYAIGG